MFMFDQSLLTSVTPVVPSRCSVSSGAHLPETGCSVHAASALSTMLSRDSLTPCWRLSMAPDMEKPSSTYSHRVMERCTVSCTCCCACDGPATRIECTVPAADRCGRWAGCSNRGCRSQTRCRQGVTVNFVFMFFAGHGARLRFHMCFVQVCLQWVHVKRVHVRVQKTQTLHKLVPKTTDRSIDVCVDKCIVWLLSMWRVSCACFFLLCS